MPALPGRRPEDEWDADGVRRLRAHLRVTQGELAARLGTRQQTVSEWETGAHAPRRMSRRLLHLVAEEAGWYDARPPAEGAGHADRGTPSGPASP